MSLVSGEADRFDAFLNGNLAGEELASFHEELLSDKALRRELLLRGHLESCLQELYAVPSGRATPETTRRTRTTSTRVRWYLLVGLLILLGGLLTPFFLPSDPDGIRESENTPEGASHMQDPGNPPTVGPSADVPHVVAAPMLNGEVLEAEEGERLVVQVPKGPRLTLHPGSRIRLYQGENQLRVFVEAGGLDSVQEKPGVVNLVYETQFLRLEGTQAELRLLAFPESSWVALSSGSATVKKLSTGEQADISWGDYAVVDPNWPLQLVDSAIYCPMWRFKSLLVAGDVYPERLPFQPEL